MKKPVRVSKIMKVFNPTNLVLPFRPPSKATPSPPPPNLAIGLPSIVGDSSDLHVEWTNRVCIVSQVGINTGNPSNYLIKSNLMIEGAYYSPVAKILCLLIAIGM